MFLNRTVFNTALGSKKFRIQNIKLKLKLEFWIFKRGFPIEIRSFVKNHTYTRKSLKYHSLRKEKVIYSVKIIVWMEFPQIYNLITGSSLAPLLFSLVSWEKPKKQERTCKHDKYVRVSVNYASQKRRVEQRLSIDAKKLKLRPPFLTFHVFQI